MGKNMESMGLLDRLIRPGFRLRNIDFDALDQFVVGVAADLDLLVQEIDAPSQTQADVIKTIREKLICIHKEESLEKNWNTAYHAEKLLLALFSDARVDIELLRRQDQCDRLKAPFAPFYQQVLADQSNSLSADVKRDLLMLMLGDLQWYKSRRYINMRYARLAIHKVGWVFVVSFLLFLLVLSKGHWNYKVDESDLTSLRSWLMMAGYIYAFAAGFFGACFFMIVDLQSSLRNSSQTELRDMWTFRMIALRCLFGIGATTILYFFFQTSLLGTGVWPDISAIDFTLVGQTETSSTTTDSVFRTSGFRLPNSDAALLIVWSFLAGYSQRLVPSILSKTSDGATQ